MPKNEVKSVKIALETRKLVIYNFAPSMPFLCLFLYFGGTFGRVTKHTHDNGFFSFSFIGRNNFQNFVKCQWEFA